jgi:hypothetical protein
MGAASAGRGAAALRTGVSRGAGSGRLGRGADWEGSGAAPGEEEQGGLARTKARGVHLLARRGISRRWKERKLQGEGKGQFGSWRRLRRGFSPLLQSARHAKWAA